MSGRHKFSELRERMDRDPVRRRRVEEKKRAFDALIDLAELAEVRKSHGLTQADMAERLGVSQPNISKIEAAAGSRTDPVESAALQVMQLSTLAGYVEALGGRLEVRALFPNDPESDVTVPVEATVVAAGRPSAEEER